MFYTRKIWSLIKQWSFTGFSKKCAKDVHKFMYKNIYFSVLLCILLFLGGWGFISFIYLFIFGFYQFLLAFFFFILFFTFTILYWFCHISTWILQRYTRVPHPEPSSLLPPCTIPLGRPSAPAPIIQYRASNLDWWLVSYMILYMFQCHSPWSITQPLKRVHLNQF